MTNQTRSVSSVGPRALVAVWLVLAVLATSVVSGAVSPARAANSGFSPRGIPLDGQVLLGAATVSDISVLEASVGGTMGIHRLYYSSGQVDGAVRQAKADLAKGRIPWISFKAPKSWSAMASGSGDAWAKDAAAKLGALNGPVWIAIHHEPEGDGPAADWKKMQQRLAPIFRAKSNIAYTIILMGWKQFFTNDSSVSMNAYWPGKQHVDVVAFDPYNWYGTTSKGGGNRKYSWSELREYYDEINKWRNSSGNADVPWAIAETAYTDMAAGLKQNAVSPAGKVVSTRGTGADWLTRAFDDMQSTGGIAMAYFHVPSSFNGEPSDWTWPIASNTKVSKFKAILARSGHLTDQPSVTLPATPTGLVASPTGTSTVSLEWAASSGATGYTVRRNGSTVGSTAGTDYTDSGLASGTAYTYTVTASNSDGTSSASAPATAKTDSPSTSSPPVAFRAASTFSGNVTRASVAVPSKVQAGDTMVLFASTNTGKEPAGAPSGWARVAVRSGPDLWSGMFTRVARSGDAGKTFDVTLSGYTKVDLTLLAYSGAGTAEPISTLASRAEASKTTQHASPALTLDEPKSLVMTYWVNRSSATSNWSLPNGQLLRTENAGSGGGRLSSVASDRGKATNSGTWSSIQATSTRSRATVWSVALTSS